MDSFGLESYKNKLKEGAILYLRSWFVLTFACCFLIASVEINVSNEKTQFDLTNESSLSLGGSLGAVSIISKHEIVLGIIGGLFVLETASVIIQVISFKLTGKRVFMMAPLHHHFEKKGWAESTVVIRFWIISIILALIGLATLKLR